MVGGEFTPLTFTTTLVPRGMEVAAVNWSWMVSKLTMQELAVSGPVLLRV